MTSRPASHNQDSSIWERHRLSALYTHCQRCADTPGIGARVIDIRAVEVIDAISSTKDVDIAIMISTMLHSIAVGNLLPARVRTVCVDINPSVVTKLADRGSHQTLGIVTDVESFLRELCQQLSYARE